MIHQGSGGFRGNAPDAVIQMQEWEHLVQAQPRDPGPPHGPAAREGRSRTPTGTTSCLPSDAKDYGIIDAVYCGRGHSLIAQAHDAGLTGGEGSAVTDEAAASEPTPKKSKE